MRPQTIPKAILLALGIAGGANAARIDVIADAALTEQNATLGVRTLTASQTWTKDNQYIITDRLFIRNGQTLTIEPGTKIYSSFSDNGTAGSKTDDKVGSIIACRGGRLVANGTSAEPIVFSSVQDLEATINLDVNGDSVIATAPTSASVAQWGGIVLLGNAYVSQSDATGANIGKAEIEGFVPSGSIDTSPVDGLADAITYGFDSTFARDDADDSGIIRYVSIRHGGYEFATSKEINGLTMGGVGSGTVIEFVEVYANSDDGYEWFGGTDSTKNLVAAFIQDDSFDMDSGHTGTHQFLFAIQNPGLADGGNELDGIESSPTSSANQAAGFNAGLTLSKPVFYNMTLIGPGSTNSKSTIAVNTGQVLTEKGNYGLTIEDYFNGEFYNSVFHDFTQDLVNFKDNATSTGATPAAAHNTIGRFGDATSGTNTTYVSGTNSNNLFYNNLGVAQNSNSAGGTIPELRTYTRTTAVGSGPGTGTFLTAIDPRPTTTSALLTANGATLQAGAPATVAFRGAFGAQNWAANWTKLSQSGVLVGGLQLLANDVDVIATPTVSTFDSALGVQALTGSQTWTNDKTYIITDRLFIKNSQTLTIQPGTKIYCSFSDNDTPASKTDDKVGAIIACRGGRLVADGTSESPIVFSSIQDLEAQRNTDVNGDSVIATAPTYASVAQWGGIVLLGNAYVSQSDSAGLNIGKAEIEGFVPSGSIDTSPVDGLADAITYGFDSTFARDDADDSGIIRYVSIRHGGYEFATSKEINGLTMGGVGSGTVIEFVEVYANSDDGYEWFGGTDSTKNLVAAFIQDDSFDMDSGHTGTHQFLFAIQNPGLADGGNELDGIESSPTSSANQAAGFNAGLTLSKPVFYNMTLIGPGSTNSKSTIAVNTGQVLTEKGNYGLTIEDYFNGEFYNSVFHDFTQDLVNFKDNATSTGATPAAAHNTIGRFGDATSGTNTTYVSGTNSNNLFYNSLGVAQNSNSAGGTIPELRTYTRTTAVGSGPGTGTFLTAIDPRPTTTSALLTANGATLQGGAPNYASYRGAFGADNWASGWTKLSASGVLVGGGSGMADADSDGISDTVEAANTALGFNAAVNDATAVLGTLKTTAQFNANFTAGQTSVTADPNSFSLYTLSNIQDLSADDIIVQKSGSSATLSIPVESSANLVPPFTSVGNATLTISGVPADKQFYRFRIAAP